jgi:hypothetical protein
MENKIANDPCSHGAYKLAGETHTDQIIAVH